MKLKRTINVVTRPKPDNAKDDPGQYAIIRLLEEKLGYSPENPERRWFRRSTIKLPSRHPYRQMIDDLSLMRTLCYQRSVETPDFIYQVNFYTFESGIPTCADFYALIGFEWLPQALLNLDELNRHAPGFSEARPADYFLLPQSRSAMTSAPQGASWAVSDASSESTERKLASDFSDKSLLGGCLDEGEKVHFLLHKDAQNDRILEQFILAIANATRDIDGQGRAWQTMLRNTPGGADPNDLYVRLSGYLSYLASCPCDKDPVGSAKVVQTNEERKWLDQLWMKLEEINSRSIS